MKSWLVSRLCTIDNCITGLTADWTGNLYFTAANSLWIFPSQATVPYCICQGSDFYGKITCFYPNIFIANQRKGEILKFCITDETVEVLHKVAGNNSSSTFSSSNGPKYITVDPNGEHIYFTAFDKIYRIKNGQRFPTEEQVKGIPYAYLNTSGITCGEQDSFYVADAQSHFIGKTTTNFEQLHEVHWHFGDASFKSPQDIQCDTDGNLLMIDNSSRIVQISIKDKSYRILGELQNIQSPTNLASDIDGNMYVGTLQGEVYKLRPSWPVLRLLWIARYKEDQTTCPLNKLNRDLIHYITAWVVGRDPFVSRKRKHD